MIKKLKNQFSTHIMRVIYITGISTSGKSTLAKQLKAHLNNTNTIDQKDFFLDDFDIDWDGFNLKILSCCLKNECDNLIVFGSALISDKMRVKPDISFYLNYNIPLDLMTATILTLRMEKDYYLSLIHI